MVRVSGFANSLGSAATLTLKSCTCPPRSHLQGWTEAFCSHTRPSPAGPAPVGIFLGTSEVSSLLSQGCRAASDG